MQLWNLSLFDTFWNCLPKFIKQKLNNDKRETKMPCDDMLLLELFTIWPPSWTAPSSLSSFHPSPQSWSQHSGSPSLAREKKEHEIGILSQWSATYLWFISSDHPKSLLPPFDGLTHLCLFQCSRGCLNKYVHNLMYEKQFFFYTTQTWRCMLGPLLPQC